MIEPLEPRTHQAIYHWGPFSIYTDQPWDFLTMHDQHIALVHVGPVVIVEFKDPAPKRD